MAERANTTPQEGDQRPDATGGTDIYWQGKWCAREVARERGWRTKAANENAQALPVLDLAKWIDADPPERSWLVADLIPYGCVTSLYGDGGAGKSMLALILMTMMASRYDHDWMGARPLGFKSVGLFAEDDGDELAGRVKRICRAYDLDYSRAAQDMRLVPAVGMDATLAGFSEHGLMVTPMMDAVVALVRDHGASLLVLDYAAALFGGNELDRWQVSEFMRRLNALARDLDVAILLLGHPSMDGMKGGRGTSGSTAWRNQSRSFLHLTVNEDQNDPDGRTLLTLSHTKSNYGRAGQSYALAFDGSRFEVLETREAGYRKVRGPRMSSSQKVALKALQRAVSEAGIPSPGGPVPLGVQCAQISLWREYAYSMGISSSDTGPARKMAFRRAQQELTAKGIVGVNEPLCWIMDTGEQ